MINQEFKSRTRLVFIVLFLLLCALVVRLSYLQYVLKDIFIYKANNQHKMSVILEPKRGEIFDSKGRIMAMSVPTKSVFAVPGEVESPYDLIDKLIPLLQFNKEDVFKKLGQKKHFVYIKRKIDIELAKKVEDLKIKGIYLQEDSKRFYPKAELLSQVIGVVNIDDEGLEGVELYLNRYLKGTPGVYLSEKDAAGREIIPMRFQEVLPVDGNNVCLTIDEVIQHIAETELEKAVKQFHPQSASIIIMDPKNGDILAMANRPTFDPNNVNDYSSENRRNRAITDFFEPGSTFKTITGVSALNEGVVRLTDKFFCENGAWRTAGHVLHDAHGHGMLTFKEIIEVSSNIGICKVGAKLGANKLCNYIKKFGFGTITGIDLPGEVSGILRDVSRWSKLSLTAIPMGQELTVTPLQLLTAYATVANGGVLIKPRIIKRITSGTGEVVKEYATVPVRKVVSEKAVKDITTALKAVVGVNGTATRANLESYEVAGKTGTAQKVGPDGRYSHTDFFSSFVGFAPADNPRVVIIVCLNEPKPQYYGGLVAAPAFKEVASRVLKYLDVLPDKDAPNDIKFTKNN